ncbi:MAG: redoxin domain-containing protein [Dehalococcoidales bacterium]|nr:MAG: redoxin domain-containing protein [Dehalococcoidales bacterium]
MPVSPQIGYQAPDFTLVDLDGNTVRLSDFRGKVVFLNFWATWCPPCRAEMPAIEEVYQEYKDEGVVVVGVDVGESKSTVRNFVEENGYSWIFVLDTTGEVSMEFMVLRFPTSFFIDSQGIIRATRVGYMNKATMVTLITGEDLAAGEELDLSALWLTSVAVLLTSALVLLALALEKWAWRRWW